MPVYEYSALDAKGKKRSGIVDADSPFAARQKLREEGAYPIEVKEAPDSAPHKEARRPLLSRSLGGGVSPRHVAVMTRQLATLVGAGLPLVRALDTLAPQMPNPALKRTMAQVKDAIVEGKSFGQALAGHPRVFPPIYINMVRAGEASGALDVVLENLANLSESQEAAKGRIRSAMVYPVLMLIVSMAVMVILMMFVVPKITAIFKDVNQALPAITVGLLAVSGAVQHYWWAMAFALAGAVFAARRIRKTDRGRHFFDRQILRAPVLGPLATNLATARFGFTLGSLLQNGVSMLQALEIVGTVLPNVIMRDAVRDAAVEVGEGKSLAAAIGKREVLPPVAVQMIDVGEHSGELELMLRKAAEMYQREAETTVNSLTALLEPVLILGMGVVVGVIVISILLPIFEMSNLAGK
jgi:general secretion pathway protein F